MDQIEPLESLPRTMIEPANDQDDEHSDKLLQ
jgi:hypothetical protein